MNGLSCSYKIEDSSGSSASSFTGPCFPSVDLFGENDTPAISRFKLNIEDPIVNVTVMSGGWVDSIQLTTRSGAVQRYIHLSY